MAYEDTWRISVHAVITDAEGNVLLLRSTYGERGWGLPGGALDTSETVHEALTRECREELGSDVRIGALTGVYFHAKHRSQALLFRCELPSDAAPSLSSEHDAWRYVPQDELSDVQRTRVRDCLEFDGVAVSRAFP